MSAYQHGTLSLCLLYIDVSETFYEYHQKGGTLLMRIEHVRRAMIFDEASAW